jgi:hypothetical protein
MKCSVRVERPVILGTTVKERRLFASLSQYLRLQTRVLTVITSTLIFVQTFSCQE